ncbi:hypothetical protein C8F01DRAFT_1255969 [Mycena amicta]|nr:hypothetical protein C8F01DRAFT_1255969 [Mycena amicta]
MSPHHQRKRRTILLVLFPQRVAYQHILFLHQLLLFVTIALTRVTPAALHPLRLIRPAQRPAPHLVLLNVVQFTIFRQPYVAREKAPKAQVVRSEYG